MSLVVGEQTVSGAAQRRRQRRLRSWLRHERMTVAMALAERKHHSSRGQTIARAGMLRVEQNGHDPETPHTPAGALQPLRRRARRVAARQDRYPVRAAGAGSAAHRAADCRCSPFGAFSWSLLQLIMEQNDDIPVPGRIGRIAGLQGFLPGQSSTALDGSLERFSERIVEQNVDVPVGGGLQDFRPGQSSSSSSRVPALVSEALDEPGDVFFFAHFSQNFKKVRSWVRTRGLELLPESSPSTQAAHVDSWVDGDDVWIRIDSVQGPYWRRLLSDRWQWYPPWEGQ